MRRWLARAALFAWELPQNVLGGALLAKHVVRRTVRGVRFERERSMVEIGSIDVTSELRVVYAFARRVDDGPDTTTASRKIGPIASAESTDRSDRARDDHDIVRTSSARRSWLSRDPRSAPVAR